MAKMEFTLTTVSPMFMYGAYQRGKEAQPEIRAQSVRGQLRYWLRAIIGAETDSLEALWKRESAVFGSTNQGSIVSVRVFAQQEIKTRSEPMLPHRGYSGGNVSPAPAITANQRFTLQLVTRPGVSIPDDALNALKVWSLLGGMGKRSRRMMGAIRLISRDEGWYENPESVNNLIQLTKNTLAKVIQPQPKRGDLPAWPTLHPQHSWVVISQRDFDSAEEANGELFELLRGNYRSSERNFGHAMQGRRASPLHAQVRRVGDAYYPVLTVLWAGPPDRDIKKKVLSDFMKDSIAKFDGVTVWGGW